MTTMEGHPPHVGDDVMELREAVLEIVRNLESIRTLCKLLVVKGDPQGPGADSFVPQHQRRDQVGSVRRAAELAIKVVCKKFVSRSRLPSGHSSWDHCTLNPMLDAAKGEGVVPRTVSASWAYIMHLGNIATHANVETIAPEDIHALGIHVERIGTWLTDERFQGRPFTFRQITTDVETRSHALRPNLARWRDRYWLEAAAFHDTYSKRLLDSMAERLAITAEERSRVEQEYEHRADSRTFTGVLADWAARSVTTWEPNDDDIHSVDATRVGCCIAEATAASLWQQTCAGVRLPDHGTVPMWLQGFTGTEGDAVTAPAVHVRHLAPRTLLHLVSDERMTRAELDALLDALNKPNAERTQQDRAQAAKVLLLTATLEPERLGSLRENA